MAIDINERNKILVGMLSLCLGTSLVDALMETSKLHDGLAGPWLDQLEQQALQGVRTMSVEGAAIESEAAAYEITLGMVSSNFEEVRRRLSETPEQE